MTPAAEPFGAHFMDASELHDLLLRSQLKQGADLKVLLYYATAVPVGEPVRTTATDIGRQLGLSTTSASRSIGRLTQQGWLQHAYTAVGVKFYRLGPNAIPLAPHPDPADSLDKPLAAVRQLHPRPYP
ncbi:MarR family transcriptional regulator [Streptomyces sp. NPDC054834]